MKNQLNKTPIVPIQQESFESILTKVQDKYEDKPHLNKVVKEVFADTKLMYHEAMQKALIQSILVAPNVKGLENEYSNFMTKDPE